MGAVGRAQDGALSTIPVVDSHTHALPRCVMSSFKTWLSETGTTKEGPKTLWSSREYSDLHLQLESLDRSGVDSAIVTHSSSTPAALHARALKEGLRPPEMIRSVNEELRSWGGTTDGRLLATAWVDPRFTQTALEEVEWASQCAQLRALSMLTAYEDGDGNLRFLDDPSFEPVLALAAELEVPIFLHASAKLDLQAKTRPTLTGLEGSYLMGSLSMPIENTLCAVRLVANGTFERHPGLRIVMGQLGGILPFLSGRFDLIEILLSRASSQAASKEASDEPRQILRHMRDYTDQLYVDTHSMDGAAILCAFETFGIEQVMFGSDFPITPERLGRPDGISLIRGLGLGASTETALLGGNASRLLSLSDPRLAQHASTNEKPPGDGDTKSLGRIPGLRANARGEVA